METPSVFLIRARKLLKSALQLFAAVPSLSLADCLLQTLDVALSLALRAKSPGSVDSADCVAFANQHKLCSGYDIDRNLRPTSSEPVQHRFVKNCWQTTSQLGQRNPSARLVDYRNAKV